MGWIGLGAQAWTEFFYEKHFANETFNFPWHKEEGEIGFLLYYVIIPASMRLKACEHASRFRFPAHPKLLKKWPGDEVGMSNVLNKRETGTTYGRKDSRDTLKGQQRKWR